jgi:hypothetical protein
VHIEHHDLNWLHMADTASIRSSEWLDASAPLSPWKLAATTVEVQLSEPLKQVGEHPTLGTPSWRAEADRLVAKFMRRHVSTEGAEEPEVYSGLTDRLNRRCSTLTQLG